MYRAVARRKLQSLLLACYRYALGTGLLSTRYGAAVFEAAYWWYKLRIEARDTDLLRAYVGDGGNVIDVGANIGFFTLKFASWVGASGRVFAIEPEPNNFARLSERVRREGYSSRVCLAEAAAAEGPGELRLAVNPGNPMDHRLADEGLSVRAITLDDLCAGAGWPTICLVKIDVQGAEARVIGGARQLLTCSSPAIFVEIEASSAPGAENGTLLIDDLASLGYTPHTLEEGGARRIDGTDHAIALARRSGYIDFLFLKTMEAG